MEVDQELNVYDFMITDFRHIWPLYLEGEFTSLLIFTFVCHLVIGTM